MLPLHGGTTRHKEIRCAFNGFIPKDSEEFQSKFLNTSFVAILFLNRTLLVTLSFPISTLVMPPPHWLEWNFALGHVKEFMCAARAFTPLTLGPTSSKTFCALQALHPSNSYFLYFLMDFPPNIMWLSMDSFRLAFLCISHLSICSPLNIVFKHF